MAKKNKNDYGRRPDLPFSYPPMRHPLAMSYDRLAAGINIPEELINEIEESGVYLGLEKKNGKGYYVGKKSSDDGNVLVLGINGSGKSSILAKGTIETWKDPFVALDIKGELSADYCRLEKAGKVKRPHIEFNLENPKMCYDVYALLDRNDPHFVQYVNEIAYAIIPKLPNDPYPFWIDTARNILAGTIIYFFGRGYGFIDTMIEIQSTPIIELCKKIVPTKARENDEHGDAADFEARPNGLVKMFVNEVPSQKPDVIGGIGAELKRHTLVFATDPFIQAALNGDLADGELPFSWRDVVDAKDPPNVFLCLPQDKLEQWGAVIRLMTTQLIRTLERRPDKHSPLGRNCPPILILLDEFPTLGKIDIITSALTTLRSKNVTFCLIIQSLAQLDLAYGELVRKIIVDNCQYKVFLNTTEPDTQKYLSDLIGTIPTVQHSLSENYDPHTESRTYGRQIREARERLIQPHEFAANKDVWLYALGNFYCAFKLPVAVTRLHIAGFDKAIANYYDLRERHISKRELDEYSVISHPLSHYEYKH